MPISESSVPLASMSWCLSMNTRLFSCSADSDDAPTTANVAFGLYCRKKWRKKSDYSSTLVSQARHYAVQNSERVTSESLCPNCLRRVDVPHGSNSSKRLK